MSLQTHNTLQLSPAYRLQWEAAQNMFVLLYPEGLIELNQSSAEILQLCDGTNTLARIVVALEKKFNTTGLENDIKNFLTVALDNGWITQST
ncbi:MAG: pyrroloquinoline quinone biosynthesis peptide chaperone PqqD [Cycloclasticus sp.]|nr:pyrroloquinoline quinone biosynthesis peptide chaperone PqqD [Cycloclasticus sp.]MBG97262.1 pyrroloquinoline quinone biosynthesis peptide chaperone PqqD [Cycloclasticus sp.]|tara:strand:- start:14 stop:289 length:276 start_codon:yes stop_codon:yes gene_type:complete